MPESTRSDKLVELIGVSGAVRWSDLNGGQAVLIDKEKVKIRTVYRVPDVTRYKLYVQNNRNAWFKCSRNYLIRCMGEVVLSMHPKKINTIVGPGKTCCIASGALCVDCKMQSAFEHHRRGEVWNIVTRSWDKKRE